MRHSLRLDRVAFSAEWIPRLNATVILVLVCHWSLTSMAANSLIGGEQTSGPESPKKVIRALQRQGPHRPDDLAAGHEDRRPPEGLPRRRRPAPHHRRRLRLRGHGEGVSRLSPGRRVQVGAGGPTAASTCGTPASCCTRPGPTAAPAGTWMASIECQLAQGCVGDLIVIRGKDDGGRRHPGEVHQRRRPRARRPAALEGRRRGRGASPGASSGGRGTTPTSRSCSTPAARTTSRARWASGPASNASARATRITVRVNGTTVNSCRDVVPVGRQDPAAVGGVRAVRPQVRAASPDPMRGSQTMIAIRHPPAATFLQAAAAAGDAGARSRRCTRRAATCCGSAWSAAAAAAPARPARRSPPTRTSGSSPWPTPSRTGSREPGTPQGATRRSAPKVDVPPERRFVGFDAYREADRQRRRRGPALHAAALPPDPPPAGGRGRASTSSPRSPWPSTPRASARCWRPAQRRRRRTSRSSRASACGTTTASARPSAGSTTARSATSPRSWPTTTGAAAGPSRSSRAGPR